jgi:SAM-dependent methyltransferase
MIEAMMAPALTSANVPSAAPATRAQAGAPPHVQLIEMAVAIWRVRAIYAAAELGLADLLAEGPGGAEELAQATGMHAPSLYRLLRALAGCGVLTEIAPRTFATTPLGDALRTGAPGAARSTVLTLAGDWQWQAWHHFLDSLRTGEPGLGNAFGTDLFSYLRDNPEHSARFNEAMVGMYGAVGQAVVAAYDFSVFGSVADLGGGTGRLLASILQSHQRVRGALLELPETASEARRFFEASALAARCHVIEGDFFESVPLGYDAYLLAHVLHDWTDEQSLTILRNCRQAISPHGKVLIIETVLPDGDVPHHGKLMDLLMLTVTGGAERTAEDFAQLLAAADFELTRIVPTSTHQSVIEAVPV